MLSDLEWMWNGHLGRIHIAKHCIEVFSADAKQFYSLPFQAGSKAQKCEKKNDRKDAFGRIYRAGSDRIESTNGIRIQLRRLSLNLRRPTQTKRCNQAKFIRDSTHELMYRFARQSRNISRGKCEQWIMENRNWKRGWRQDPLSHTTDFIGLSKCRLDFGMLRVRSSEGWMLHFQRSGGRLHWCISTILFYSRGLRRNKAIMLNIY